MGRLVRDGFKVYCVEEEGTWLYEELPALLSVDKSHISPGGEDKATVTVETPYDSGAVTVSVVGGSDEFELKVQDGIATLEVSSVDVGIIRLRVGQETASKANEVAVQCE